MSSRAAASRDLFLLHPSREPNALQRSACSNAMPSPKVDHGEAYVGNPPFDPIKSCRAPIDDLLASEGRKIGHHTGLVVLRQEMAVLQCRLSRKFLEDTSP
ncbi:unnamed protein product [Ectocarpus sp. 12 AP-2014]